MNKEKQSKSKYALKVARGQMYGIQRTLKGKTPVGGPPQTYALRPDPPRPYRSTDTVHFSERGY